MKEFESKRWPIGLREFMDKGKTKGFTEWEEFFKWYENAKRYGLIPDRRSMSMRKEKRWKK